MLGGRWLSRAACPLSASKRQWPRLTLLCSWLPFHVFSPFPLSLPLISCKLPAETLYSLVSAPGPALPKGQAACPHARGWRLLGVASPPQTAPSSGPPVQDLRLKRHLPQRQTCFPGIRCSQKRSFRNRRSPWSAPHSTPASQGPRPVPSPPGGRGIASPPPQSPAPRPSLHPLPRAAWGNFLLSNPAGFLPGRSGSHVLPLPVCRVSFLTT